MNQKIQKTKVEMTFIKIAIIFLIGAFFKLATVEQEYANLFIVDQEHKKDYWFFLTNLDVTLFSIFKVLLFFSTWGIINSYIRNLKRGQQFDFIDRFFLKGINKIKTTELSIAATLLYETFRFCLIFSIILYAMFTVSFSVIFNSFHDLNFIPTGEEEYRSIVMNLLIICSALNTFITLKFKSNKKYLITPLFLGVGFFIGFFYISMVNSTFSSWKGKNTSILDSDIYIVYDFIFAGVLAILGIIGLLRLLHYIETRNVNGKGTMRERDLVKRNEILAIPPEKRTSIQRILLDNIPDETYEYKTLKESSNFGRLDYVSIFLFIIASSVSIIGTFTAFKGSIDVNNTAKINDHIVHYRDHNSYIHESNTQIVEGFIEYYLGASFISTDSHYDITYLGKIAYENNKHEELIKAISNIELNYIKNKETYREQILNYKYDKQHYISQVLLEKQMNDIFVGLIDFQHLKQFHKDILDGNYQKAVDEYQAILNTDYERKEGLSKEELRKLKHYDSLYSSHIFAILNETGLAKVDKTINSTESHIEHFQKFDTQKENVDDNGYKLKSTKEDLDRIIELFL